MAYVRSSEKTVVVNNLNGFINAQLSLVYKLQSRRDLEDESRFQNSVKEDNLTLDQQLSYRTEQMTRTKDKDERKRIREEIASIRDQIEAKKFTDSYTEQVMSLNDGTASINSTISWLENKKSRTTDQNIITKINSELITLKDRQYEASKSALASATEFANNNKTQSILSSQMDRVKAMKAKALIAGNDDYAAVLDLQYQSLEKSMNETKVNDATLSIAVMGATGGSALSIMDAYNKQIENADKTTPITIGGVKYDSMEQYWSLTRSKYLNDKGENGFFSAYQSEIDKAVQYKQSRGALTNDSLGEVKDWYEKLKTRPELADYQDQLSQTQQSSLQSAADMRATSILNTYATKNDTENALSQLSTIQDKYGVDQTTNYQKIVSSAASDKKDQVQQILSTMSAIMSANPGISNEAAMTQAIKSGAGASFSSEELATSNASTLIKNAGDKAGEQAYSDNDGLTIPKNTASQFPQFKEGGLYRKPSDITVYRMEGGKLRPLNGDWNEDALKKLTGGQGYGAVKVVDNLNGLGKGAEIRAVDYLPPKYAEGGLYREANSNTVYKYTGGKLRGLSGNWDEVKLKKYTGGQGYNAVKLVDKVDQNLFGSNVDADNEKTWKL